jgi:hypothetical protein
MVKVAWHDHGTIDGWTDIDELIKKESYVCETLGYYIGQNSKAIFVVQGRCEETGNAFNTQLILKNSIISIISLRG